MKKICKQQLMGCWQNLFLNVTKLYFKVDDFETQETLEKLSTPKQHDQHDNRPFGYQLFVPWENLHWASLINWGCLVVS